jgi:predicted nucleotidyltransferase
MSLRTDVLAVGFFGSYARGDWGVGSDLDVVVLVTESSQPALRRSIDYDTVTGFPVPVDLLVYTTEEWERPGDDPSFLSRLRREVKWVARRA